MAASGSEKRQRRKKRTVRFSSIEDAMIRLHADLAGVSVAAYLRAAALNEPLPRKARRPTTNHQDVVQLLGNLGRVASAFREAAALGDGQAVTVALNDLAEMRLLCFQSLGKAP